MDMSAAACELDWYIWEDGSLVWVNNTVEKGVSGWVPAEDVEVAIVAGSTYDIGVGAVCDAEVRWFYGGDTVDPSDAGDFLYYQTFIYDLAYPGYDKSYYPPDTATGPVDAQLLRIRP